MNQEVRSSSTKTIKLGSQRKGKCKQVATQGSQGSGGVLFHVAPETSQQFRGADARTPPLQITSLSFGLLE